MSPFTNVIAEAYALSLPGQAQGTVEENVVAFASGPQGLIRPLPPRSKYVYRWERLPNR